MMLETHYYEFDKGETNYQHPDEDGHDSSHLANLDHGGFLFWGKLKFSNPENPEISRI